MILWYIFIKNKLYVRVSTNHNCKEKERIHYLSWWAESFHCTSFQSTRPFPLSSSSTARAMTLRLSALKGSVYWLAFICFSAASTPPSTTILISCAVLFCGNASCFLFRGARGDYVSPFISPFTTFFVTFSAKSFAVSIIFFTFTLSYPYWKLQLGEGGMDIYT